MGRIFRIRCVHFTLEMDVDPFACFDSVLIILFGSGDREGCGLAAF